MASKHRKIILWTILFSEGMHVFCCVLPTLFSVFSLMAGMGMVAVMPPFLQSVHDVLHDYELPMIAGSFVVLLAGWGLHWYSRKVDCHDTGCGHGPCAPKKDKVQLLLIAATVLFAVNVTVYFVFHRTDAVPAVHDHHDHGHDHSH